MRSDFLFPSVTVLLVLVYLLLLPSAAFACLWDTDTLANEAKGLPDVVQVITGRFERNPPLYFEMRLKRVTEELAKEPGLLADYDDAGVACDRLSRDDEAIAWMQKKRVQLQKLDRNSPEVKEHWYHYYANIGTFRAHRWFRAGADRKHISELEQARDEIGKAIEINPNAHFGREKVQQAIMDWVINPVDKKQNPIRLARALPGDSQEKVKGLCGLIVLGNAWESVDVFLALTEFQVVRGQIVQYLASLRCRELIDRGRHSALPDRFPDSDILKLTQPGRYTLEGGVSGEVKEQYQLLRAEAEEWQKQRTEYMLVRLNAGRHPDTDPAFWNEWHDSGPPSLAVPWYRYLSARVWAPHFIAQHFGVYLGSLIGLIVGLRLAILGWRRWRTHRVPFVREKQ